MSRRKQDVDMHPFEALVLLLVVSIGFIASAIVVGGWFGIAIVVAQSLIGG